MSDLPCNRGTLSPRSSRVAGSWSPYPWTISDNPRKGFVPQSPLPTKLGSINAPLTLCFNVKREGRWETVNVLYVRVSESESVWVRREILGQHIHVGRGNSAAVFKPGFKPECLQLLQHTSGFFQSSHGSTEQAISSFIIILSSVNSAHKLSKYHSSQGQNSKNLTSTWKFFHHDLTCGTAHTVLC